MFVATEDIAEFKKGDEVPDARAKVWLNMYLVPPVKEVGPRSVEAVTIQEVALPEKDVVAKKKRW